ncbi:F-box protein CPR1-like [Solanum dulcamara]|uniref:F-box protein CPR1-like n=1 Tax=Solanum dulcamara TaxID=45834 RepID=UPI002484F866|nr:F-box protein CPR1-like [Solanum dulcamara]
MLLYMPHPALPLKSCTLRSLFYQNVTESFDLDCPMKYNYLYEKFPWPDWISGSVNGLICFAAGENDLFIGNPSIRKYRKLPYPRSILMKSVRWPRYSFGYDEFHDDYKVVGVFTNCYISDQDETHICLKDDSWRSVDDCPSEILLNGSGIFLTGKLRWDTAAPGLNVYNGGNVYSFDLADEKWRKTVEQRSYQGGGFVSWLTVLASDLSIFCDYEGTHIDVWVMEKYGVKESWTIMFCHQMSW